MCCCVEVEAWLTLAIRCLVIIAQPEGAALFIIIFMLQPTDCNGDVILVKTDAIDLLTDRDAVCASEVLLINHHTKPVQVPAGITSAAMCSHMLHCHDHDVADC